MTDHVQKAMPTILRDFIDGCEHDDEDCPQDDTCECANVAAYNTELAFVGSELAELDRLRTKLAGGSGRLATESPLAALQRQHNELIATVRSMRDAQKRYFKTKAGDALTESKQLEKAVDLLLDPPKPDRQQTLFDGGGDAP